MKKLLITNLVTAVVVLGIIAAYSFKPEQKAGAKYAVLTFDFSQTQPRYTMIITAEGKTETLSLKAEGKNAYDYLADRTLQTTIQLEKLEAQGFQLISTDVESNNSNMTRTYTLRKP